MLNIGFKVFILLDLWYYLYVTSLLKYFLLNSSFFFFNYFFRKKVEEDLYCTAVVFKKVFLIHNNICSEGVMTFVVKVTERKAMFCTDKYVVSFLTFH